MWTELLDAPEEMGSNKIHHNMSLTSIITSTLVTSTPNCLCKPFVNVRVA